MGKVMIALVDALLGVGAIWLGLRFHFGSWYIDGPLGYVGAALAGAVVAIVLRYAVRKEFG